MLHLIGFIRKKSTKLYILMLTSVGISVLLISVALQYYQNQRNYIYRDNSYFIMNSNIDLLEIKKESNITNLKKVALLNLDDLNIDSDDFDKNFLADCDNTFVILESSANVSDNNVSIVIPNIINKNKETLLNKNFEIKFNSELNNFNIDKVFSSNFARVILSVNDFEKFNLGNTYIFDLKDYSEINNILSKYNQYEDCNIKFIQYASSSQIIDTIDSLQNMINIIKKVCNIILLIFCVCFIIIIENIINDEFEEMKIEKLIGYNKNIIKHIICKKLIFIDAIVFGIIFIIAYVLKNIILIFFKFDFLLFSDLKIIYIMIFVLFSSMFMCILHKDKKH